MEKKFMVSLLFFGMLCALFSNEIYTEGLKLLSEKKYDRAIEKLLIAAQNPLVDPQIYAYLGVAYFENGAYEQSLAAFEKGCSIPFIDKTPFYFNAGNTAFVLEKFEIAENYFTLAIDFDGAYFRAYLNRANTRIKLNKIDLAVKDYELYLQQSSSNSDTATTEKIRLLLEKYYSTKSPETTNDANLQENDDTADSLERSFDSAVTEQPISDTEKIE